MSYHPKRPTIPADYPQECFPVFKWTTEPPTEPGWYWVTYAGGVSVIKVRQDEKGLWIEDGYYSDQRLAIDSAWKYHSHWLGPLPEPDLPK